MGGEGEKRTRKGKLEFEGSLVRLSMVDPVHVLDQCQGNSTEWYREVSVRF